MKKALETFAASDMRKARDKGSILIVQTKQGVCKLSYYDNYYKLVVCGLEPKTLAAGPARVVKPILASIYQVVAQ